jgi:epoxyqueuosine reductase
LGEENLKDWIEIVIKKFSAGPENDMRKWGEPAWGEPLIGYSNGADPLYPFYKKDIGEFYMSPLEFIGNRYQDEEFDPTQLTVVSWILPQTEATKRDHRLEKHFPSERWARSRIYGENFNDKLKEHVVDTLNNHGYMAVAPTLSPLWRREVSRKYAFASTWSERHAAYAAGLGTFGLSDGLITPVGKAMRAGSVIVNAYIQPSERPYDDHHAYCLFYAEGSCGDCIKRCPIGAITPEGHNKYVCQKYVAMTHEYVERQYGFEGYGCGLCQTGVPCESCIPSKLLKNDRKKK